jgi:hypothetical protein
VCLIVAAGVSAMRAQKEAVARRQSLEEAAAKTNPAAFKQMEEGDGADRRRQDKLAEDQVAAGASPSTFRARVPSVARVPPGPAFPPSPGCPPEPGSPTGPRRLGDGQFGQAVQ